MIKFLVILTVFASPTQVASNAPLTLQPETTIQFEGTSEKTAIANCARVQKAMKSSGKTAYCETEDHSAE